MIVHGEELLVPAHLNFGKFILDRLRNANPDDVCLLDRDTGKRLTYNEFTQHAVGLSVSLKELGVGIGDTVLVAAETRVITFVPTTLAVVLAGAAFTPIDFDCGNGFLLHKINLTKPKYVICCRLFWETYRDVFKGLDFIQTFICFEDIEDMQFSVERLASRQVDIENFEPCAVRGESDVAMVVYSSGTTDMTKGVALTHLNCIAASSCRWYYDIDNLKTCFIIGDLCYSYGLLPAYHFFSAGKKVIYAGQFESQLVLKTIQDCQVDTMPTIPIYVQNLLNAEDLDKYDITSLKTLHSCSAPLDLAVIKALKQRLPHVKLLQLYGTTEVSILTAQTTSNSDTTTVGVAVPGVTLKVVDVETRLVLGPNQRGEICARTPCLMKGYLGVDSAPLDEQGYYRTGDLGYYDNHKNFYVVDRLKDVISCLGVKISPKEYEIVLMKHAAVLEAAVVGKPTDVAGQEVPAAFVVLRPGAVATETEILDYVAKEVPSFMCLDGGVRFVLELPKSSRKKVLRQRLREMLVELE